MALVDPWVDVPMDDLGQLLLIRLDDHQWSSSCERVLRRFEPGGVILSLRNLRSPRGTAEMLGKIARVLSVPPFLVLEEEGGAFDPLHAFFPPAPSPRLAATLGARAVARLGSLIGQAFMLLGFNTNLAPRLNLASPPVKSSLDQQSFSSDPRVVARCGKAFVAALRCHGILACGKHFPGLGAAKSNFQSVLPLVDKPMATLWRNDLLPFRQLLPQLAMVKLSYAAYKAYDLDFPISASESVNVIEGLLHVKLGYRGVAVVDPFESLREMKKGRPASTAGDKKEFKFLGVGAAAKSIVAGCDMLVVGSEGRSLEVAAENLKLGLENGSLSKQRVADALKRIRRAKKGISLPTGKLSKQAFDRLCREFEEFSKNCRSAERKDV
jgi:beta-N-acetylhexosaminidase